MHMATRGREIATQCRSRDTATNGQNLEEAQDQDFTQNSEEQSTKITDSSRKRVRGITNGSFVEKHRHKTEKLDVIVHPLRKRIVGDNAKHFKTEACVILKQHAPLQFARWKHIPDRNKKKMWFAMKQKFNLEDNSQTQKVVYEQLNKQYRTRRNKLHSYYLNNKFDEDILVRPPEGVKPCDWEHLISYFESDDFKVVSARNSVNRSKLNVRHTCGTKSIAQYCYENRDTETGEELTRTESWKKTHYSKRKNDWVDQESGRVYDQLTRLQNPEDDDDKEPMTEDQAFIEILGPEKSNRLRGCGDGMKPPSKDGPRIDEELEKENIELKKKAAEDKECMKEMALRIEALETQSNNQEAQVQAQVQTFLKAQFPNLFQNTGEASQIHLQPNV